MLRGPESRVLALQNVKTESIWIGGRKESFTAPNVAIDVPDPKVDLVEPIVSIDIEIGERRVEKTFSGVAAASADGGKVQPASVSATVLGPASMVESLKTEELKVVFDGTNARLELPPAVKGKVSLKSLQPGKFTLVK